MRTSISCALIAVFFILALGVPREAAAKGIIFYQTGEDIFEAGPLPAPFNKEKKLVGAKAGYKCQIFGLFLAYMHIWGCKPVAYLADSYMDGTELEAAITKAYPQSEMKVGLWKKHGRWLFALIIIAAIAGFFMKGGDDDDEDEEDEDEEDDEDEQEAKKK